MTRLKLPFTAYPQIFLGGFEFWGFVPLLKTGRQNFKLLCRQKRDHRENKWTILQESRICGWQCAKIAIASVVVKQHFRPSSQLNFSSFRRLVFWGNTSMVQQYHGSSLGASACIPWLWSRQVIVKHTKQACHLSICQKVENELCALKLLT